MVVGACTGSDAHTVGIDAILNYKGYAGDKGLESYKGFEVYNLGAQVENDQLAAWVWTAQGMRQAVLLGGNVLVPEGKLVGGDFQNVPACQAAAQTGCVIAYSTFLKEPPEGSFFGRAQSPLLDPGATNEGMQVLCVNPTLLSQNGGTGPLLPYASTTPFMKCSARPSR